MSYLIENNIITATGAVQGQIFYYLKNKMKLQGWSVKYSSDGTTFSGSDIITSAGTGTGGMSNSNAWVVLRSPSVAGKSREVSFRRAPLSATTSVYVVYSPGGLFTASSTSAPTATDAQTIINSTSLYTNSTASTYKTIVGAGDVNEKYSWFIATFNTTTTAYNGVGFLAYDYMQDGTSPSNDADPIVWWQNLNNPTVSQIVNGNWHNAFYLKGTASEAYTNLSAYIPQDGSGVNVSGILPNPINNKVDLVPVILGRGNGYSFPRGIKGISRVVNYCLPGGGYVKSGDALTISTTKDKIALNQIALPWDGTDPIF
jgi:hypothetical protein